MHLQVLNFDKTVGPEATFLTLSNHFDMHTNFHNKKCKLVKDMSNYWSHARTITFNSDLRFLLSLIEE